MTLCFGSTWCTEPHKQFFVNSKLAAGFEPLSDCFQPPTEGCGADVGCFRQPPGCLPENCDFLLTWLPLADVVEFNFSVAAPSSDVTWAAVGFSRDPLMVNHASLRLLVPFRFSVS